MPQYVAALYQGTTSTRCMLFDHSGRVKAVAQKEHRQIFPQPGWVEHDPGEIWARSVDVISGALDGAGVGSREIVAVGVTNQRETTIVWDAESGRQVAYAEYHLKGKGGYSMMKWQGVKTKMDPVMDQLLAGVTVGPRIAATAEVGPTTEIPPVAQESRTP